MPRGHPDWQRPSDYPRTTGRPIILFDDLEPALFKWTAVSGGPAPAGNAVRNVATAYNGNACLEIFTGGGGAGAWTYGQRFCFLKDSQVVSVEAIWAAQTWANIDNIHFHLYWNNGGNLVYGGMQYEPATNTWSVLTVAGYIPVLVEPSAYGAWDVWHFFKMTLDFGNMAYVTFQTNDAVTPLGQYGLWPFGPVAGEWLHGLIYVEQTAAGVGRIYVDDYGIYEEYPKGVR